MIEKNQVEFLLHNPKAKSTLLKPTWHALTTVTQIITPCCDCQKVRLGTDKLKIKLANLYHSPFH